MPRHKNECICERCEQRRAGLPITAKTKTTIEQTEPRERPSGIPGEVWKSFKTARPKIGDQILYFGGSSGSFALALWNKNNEDNVQGLIELNSQWVKVLKPFSV